MIYIITPLLTLLGSMTTLFSGDDIQFSFETASDDMSKVWGLMGRAHLPENHGMLFDYPKTIWMFNMQIDLSVAFINKEGVILAIRDLSAYPQMMDPQRKIHSVEDLHKYPSNDKIYQFFLKKAVNAPQMTRYALEMNKGWFHKYKVQTGDIVYLRKFEGFIKKKNLN